MPKRPGYLDKKKGRNPIILTSQNISASESGVLRLPGFLEGLRIRARHRKIRQVRILTTGKKIRIQLMYEKEEQPVSTQGGTMGIDLGVNNLLAVCMDTENEPVLINGRPVKSINQYYNKKKAELQSAAQKGNSRKRTARMERLTRKRNSRIKDYMHKASRHVVNLAKNNGISTIVIGRNPGWKQDIALGNRTNQSFVEIPYRMLIQMITYKAALAGIRVLEVIESYTSGTSYLDRETPEKENYNKSRRVFRGLFRSNSGSVINADINAGYQMMKKAGIGIRNCKGIEAVRKPKVA